MKSRSPLYRLSAGLLSVLMVFPGAAIHAQGVGPTMATATNFRVTEAGAASYEISIRVPPGTVGMQPKLALVYNSQGGMGVLGKGWSLSGLSAVMRCPRTVAQDGVRGTVQFNANDRFCLDGQRLIAISGTYGGDGAEYRTERESFARITSHGVAGTGPAWWLVKTKSGQVIQFGNTADSRVEAQGLTTVRTYAVNKVTDRDGNYMSVTYTEDSTNGDHYPTRIDYTGNAASSPALTPGQSVRFVYESRPDNPKLYQAGSLVRSMVRLKNIQTYVGSTLVTDYRVAYQTSPDTSRSRITSITECPPSPGACLPAITLAWSAPAANFGTDTNWRTPAEAAPAANSRGSRVNDLNADGLPDFIYEGASRAVHVLLSTGNAFQADSTWGTRAVDFHSSGGGLRFADLNRDGRADLVYHGTGGTNGAIRVMLSSGTSLGTDTQWGTPAEAYNTADSGRLMVIDLNGDDRPDVIYDGTTGMRVLLNTGTSFGTDASWGTRGAAYATNSGGFQLADMNGDGFPDVVYDSGETSGTGIRVKINNGANGFGADQIWGYRAAGVGYNTTLPGFYLADANGDGLPDFVYDTPSNTVRVLVNKGNALDADVQWGARAASYSSTTPGLRLEDVNGDERADVVYHATDGIRVLLSTGSAFGSDTIRGTLADSVNTGDAARLHLADVGGDGRGDIVYFGTNAIRVLPTTGGTSDLATAFSNGIGLTASITHKPLTDSTVYTKDTTATYPLRDIRVPIYVAASHTTSNGIGGTSQMTYFYTGAKLDMGGRGMLGFRIVQSTEPQGLKNIQTFRQDWPYAGLPSQIKRTRADNGVISQVDNTYACKDFDGDPDVCTVAAGKRYFPYVSQSDEVVNDLNGTFMNKTRTANTFDIYGNATQIAVTTLNADSTTTGFSKTTNNTYSNDATNWILGRLTRATVTSNAP